MHPSESTLALYAGQDLSLWSRWRIARHLNRCGRCGRQVDEFRAVREWTRAQDGEMPEGVEWEALEAELKANIRLGLAAGRCVAPAAEAPAAGFQWKPAIAISILLIVMAGWLLQSWPGAVHRPAPAATASVESVLDVSPAGIGLERDGRAFQMLHPRAENVVFSVSGPSAVRARYVDGDTGYVTISHVYAQ